MRIKRTIGLLLTLFVVVTGILWHASRSSKKAFDQQKWNQSRQNSPVLNLAPQMLDDLLSRHLSLGMSLSATTNLIGSPETIANSGQVLWIRGGSCEQIAYVYMPGIHKGWKIEGSNALTLSFSADGMSLQEWSPWVHTVKRTTAIPEVSGVTDTDGRLLLGNPQVANNTNQIIALLGPPDERHTEYEFNYYLGRRWRFAWDEVFLELHFDGNKKLTRIVRSEH